MKYKIHEITIDTFHQKAIDVATEPTIKSYDMNPSDLEIFMTCYHDSKIKPKRALKNLLPLKEKYPNALNVTNLLAFLYVKRKQFQKAESIVKESFEKNPNDLCTRINYADQCLRKKRLDEIPKIFDHKYDLRLLYPEKKVFHPSEYQGFMTLMGFYHLAINNKEHASCYHTLAYKIDPSHSGVKLLGKKLYHTSILTRLLNRFRSLKSR